MKTKYLITGATGHLGLNLLWQLSAAKKDCRALVLPHDPNRRYLPAGVELIEGNVCDRVSLKAFFTAPADTRLVVIHAAGIVTIADGFDQKVWDINVNGTRNIITMCRRYAVSKLVYVSSVHAMPELPGSRVMEETRHFDPALVRGLYAKTKAEATRLVLQAARNGLNASVCQPSGMLGPMDYAHGHLTQLILNDQLKRLPICVRGGYDFVDARDVAQGILACCDKGQAGACYLLTGRYVTIPALLITLHHTQNQKGCQPAVPCGLAKAFAPFAEADARRKKEKPLFTAYSLETLRSNALFNHKKAQQELGFTVRPLEETLRDTVDFLLYSGALAPTQPVSAWRAFLKRAEKKV